MAGSPTKKKVKKEVEFKMENEKAVVEELEGDDVATTVRIKSENLGEVQMQIPDIEDIGRLH